MIEVPQFLSHLRTYRGHPVPFTQMWIDGKPDFRVVDPEKSIKCIHEKLCAICGVKLGEFCYFIASDARAVLLRFARSFQVRSRNTPNVRSMKRRDARSRDGVSS